MLSIRNKELERELRELAAHTGRGMTDLLLEAVREYAGEAKCGREPTMERLDRISCSCSALPDIDTRSQEEILGYGIEGAF